MSQAVVSGEITLHSLNELPTAKFRAKEAQSTLAAIHLKLKVSIELLVVLMNQFRKLSGDNIRREVLEEAEILFWWSVGLPEDNLKAEPEEELEDGRAQDEISDLRPLAFFKRVINAIRLVLPAEHVHPSTQFLQLLTDEQRDRDAYFQRLRLDLNTWYLRAINPHNFWSASSSSSARPTPPASSERRMATAHGRLSSHRGVEQPAAGHETPEPTLNNLADKVIEALEKLKFGLFTTLEVAEKVSKYESC
ncbi:hypothetical protein T439DRAFT_384448 [Meredithblackwellia eburnea MCA 4105]